jgi:hypothetical protein
MNIEIDKHRQYSAPDFKEIASQERLFELEKLDPDDLGESALKKIVELKKKIEELQNEIQGLRTRSITKKRLMMIILKQNFFTRKKKRLIRALSSCKPVSISTLRKLSSSKNVKSLKVLIYATRKHIAKHPELKGAYSIVNLKKSGQYQLIINPDRFSIVIK